MTQSVQIDAIDRAIIAALQEDGRASYAELATIVGLSPPAVRQRMQRLMDSELMQVVAVTDPLKLGLPVMALVGLKVDGDVRAIADTVGAIDEVIYVVLTSGSFDLFVEVVCADLDQLFEVMNNHIKQVDGVTGTESFVYYGIHTHQFNWGAPGGP